MSRNISQQNVTIRTFHVSQSAGCFDQQWRIQDFSDEGVQPMSMGQKSITRQDFCRKMHENERNWTKSRRFKRPPKQQNRRRNGILFNMPSFVSTPDSFFPANWPPLQEASQLFPVRVLYYILLVNCNITKYT